MDATTKQHLQRLPLELRRTVLDQAVLKRSVIKLSTADQDFDELVKEPFANDTEILVIASEQFFTVNTFSLRASETIIAHDTAGAPHLRFIVGTNRRPSLATRRFIRRLEVHIVLTLEGADWGAAVPVAIDAHTTALIAALPMLFPRLDSVLFEVLNWDAPLNPNAVYTHGAFAPIPVTACPKCMVKERSARIFMLTELIASTAFPRWKQGGGVKKMMVLVQDRAYWDRGPTLPVYISNFGGPSPSPLLNRRTQREVWEFCDWPRVSIKLD